MKKIETVLTCSIEERTVHICLHIWFENKWKDYHHDDDDNGWCR